MRPEPIVLRHEELTERVGAGLGQFEAEGPAVLGQHPVGDLDQDAGAVTGERVGADRAAMLEVFQDEKGILDDLVASSALHVGNEADPAGIEFAGRVKKASRLGCAVAEFCTVTKRHLLAFPRMGPGSALGPKGIRR